MGRKNKKANKKMANRVLVLKNEIKDVLIKRIKEYAKESGKEIPEEKLIEFATKEVSNIKATTEEALKAIKETLAVTPIDKLKEFHLLGDERGTVLERNEVIDRILTSIKEKVNEYCISKNIALDDDTISEAIKEMEAGIKKDVADKTLAELKAVEITFAALSGEKLMNLAMKEMSNQSVSDNVASATNKLLEKLTKNANYVPMQNPESEVKFKHFNNEGEYIEPKRVTIDDVSERDKDFRKVHARLVTAKVDELGTFNFPENINSELIVQAKLEVVENRNKEL